MDAACWEQIKELYHAALERPEAERAPFLAVACAGNEELHHEATALLAAHAAAPDFLAVPALEREAKAAATFARPAIPEQFSHYQILAPLGAGGMGEVWMASDTRLGRKVALKVLPAQFTTDPERVWRFAQEARTASALNHPNIITIHEIGEVENTHYLVTEYVAGETLRQRMMDAPEQRMTVSETIDLAVQIAAALIAAHEAGITHRDIKPENVMVRHDGIVKLLDFGLAKLTEPQALESPSMVAGLSTDSGVVRGTPRYMSPEQARGEKVDVRTDLFSLGVMLYEMITGRAPFTGTTTSEVIAAILRDEPPSVTEVATDTPLDFVRIIGQALRKDRADRYQTARALLTDLKELKQQLELQAKLGLVFPSAGGNPGSQNIPLKANAVRKPFEFLASVRDTITDWVARSRPPVLTEKDLIVLADFENKTGDPVFDVMLKQALAIQLRQTPFLSLFPEERVRHTLRLMKLSPEERVTARIAQEICLRHNLKALIAGSIAPLGSHYVIALEAIHGQTGWTLETEQVEARSKEQVLRALSQAAARLRAKLGESLSSIQQFDRELEETTTEKLAAFQSYSLGYEQTLNGRLVDAIQLYRHAVELDPDFSYAWSMLSIHNSVFGRPGLAAEYAEKAYALREGVSDYEQLQVTFR